jgi:hypothetical protein
MVPLVGTIQELELVRDEACGVAEEVAEASFGCRSPGPDRHDDRAAARGPDGRPDRRGGGVLLLRHQRPHPDDVGLQPRRRRGVVLLGLPREGRLRRSRRSSRIDARGSASWSRSPSRRAGATQPDLQTGRLRRARRRSRPRSTSSTRSGWTTCRARRSGCRSPAWRPAETNLSRGAPAHPGLPRNAGRAQAPRPRPRARRRPEADDVR